MKKNEIENEVRLSFRTAEKLFHKIVTGFHLPDLTLFRSEIKKLKCFLHLLNIECADKQLALPKKLKTFYGYTGVIRNVQVHKQRIEIACKDASSFPKLYIGKLESELRVWKNNTKSFIDFENNFFDDEDAVLAGLPEKLTGRSVRKFAEYISFEMNNLLPHIDDDETILSLRKLLQDIVFNFVYIKKYFRHLPALFSNVNELGSFLKVLDGFNDKCIDITLLETYCDDSCTLTERKLLKHINDTWRNEKAVLGRLINEGLHLLDFAKNKIFGV